MSTQPQPGNSAARVTAIETRSIDYVPENERHGSIGQQVRFWFLGNFVFLTAAVGFLGPSLHLPLGWSILAAGAGNFVGALFMGLHASQGPRLGLPQLIQSRAQMGYRGVVAALVATLLVFVGLNILGTLVLANGLNAIYGWNTVAVAVGGAVIAVVTAVWGHNLLHRAFTLILIVSAPLFLVLGFGIITGNAGGGPMQNTSFSLSAFMIAFAGAASYNIAFAPFVSDFTRYMPRNTPQWKVVGAVVGGAGLSGFIMIALGCWMASALGATDALSGIKTAGDNILSGYGTVMVIVAVIAQVATAGMTAYSAHLTVITGIDSFKRIRPSRAGRAVVIAALAVVWTYLAVALPSSYLNVVNTILVIMLYLLVPWSGLNLVDFFLVRRSRYAILDLFTPNGIYGQWSWRGLLAYVLGFLSMIPFAVFSFYTGPVAEALGGVDISWLVGLVVSGLVYLFAARGLDYEREQAAIQASEVALQGESAHASV